MPNRPTQGGSPGTWGTELNAWLDATVPPVFNVKGYGAAGGGVTDDTTAINNAATAALAANGLLYFPPGTYNYNGTGINGTQVRVAGAGADSTTIVLGATSRFILITTAISDLHVSGLSFSGGIDVIKSTFTGTNVINFHVVEDCLFSGYTGAAISDNSSDWPYWKINRCEFNGANDTTTVGVALSGLTDACSITECSFQRNRVHVKLRQGGNNAHVSGCDFIQYGAYSGTPRVAVWVVPYTAITNAGPGFTATSNKFGNENLDAADYKILYADEDTAAGSDNGSYFPKLSADSTGYIIGHRITDNNFMGISTPSPIIYSTTPNIRGLNFGPILIGTGEFSYLLQFRTVPTTDRSNIGNIFGPLHGGDLASELTTGIPVSNGYGIGKTLDPNGLLDTRMAVPISRPGGGDPVDFSSLLPTVVRSFSVSNATLANVADVYGGIDATEVTFTTAAGFIYTALTMGNIQVGQPCWIEFDVKAGSSSPLTLLRVDCINTGVLHDRRVYEIPSVWRRIRLLHPGFRSAAGASYIEFTTNQTETGKVQIGRVRVYQCREPVNDGVLPIASGSNRIFSGSGVPAAGLGTNGDFYFRIDTPGTATQRLYVKSAGTWVGTAA